MKAILLTAALLLAAEPVLASPIGEWQCERFLVVAYIDKSTDPRTTEISFIHLEPDVSGNFIIPRFVYMPDKGHETSGTAYLNGKQCQKVCIVRDEPCE
jgi:hypothetical protein